MYIIHIHQYHPLEDEGVHIEVAKKEDAMELFKALEPYGVYVAMEKRIHVRKVEEEN